ncbi:MAG: LIM domain-containing protein [archaeon]|nr:LIM domain-containing protein [archaeon]
MSSPGPRVLPKSPAVAPREVTCHKCGLSIGGGKAFHWSGRVFHPPCFQCTDCQVVLTNQDKFCYIETNLYCSVCYNLRTPVSAAGFCGECGRALVTSYLQIRTAKFHTDCFVCSRCHKPFGERGFAEIDGEACCAACVLGEEAE